MEVRYPSLDYSKVRAHWCRNLEFAQAYNAAHLVPAYIEPYLIKVMRRVKDRLDPAKHARLIRDIDIFNGQEGQHCKNHMQFLKRLREQGYPRIAEFEREYQADYDRFLAEESLEFNVAYCEGFEAMGMAGAPFWLDEIEDLLAGADAEPVELWKWHLAEEYEHRHVAFEVFKAICGRGLTGGYMARVKGYVTAIKHIGGYTKRLQAYLLGVDRATMTPEQLQASMESEQAYGKRRVRAYGGRLLAVFSPFYNSVTCPAPKSLQKVLDRYAGTAPSEGSRSTLTRATPA